MIIMINKDFIYQHILSDPFYEMVLKKYAKDKELRDELRQIIWLSLCQMDVEKLEYLYNNKQLKYYYIGILNNQVKSSTSQLHKQWRLSNVEWDNKYQKEVKESVEDIYINNEEEKIKNRLNEKRLNAIKLAKEELLNENALNFVYLQLFDLYYLEGLTYRGMAKKLNLPKTTCYTYTKIGKEMIMKKLDDILWNGRY